METSPPKRSLDGAPGGRCYRQQKQILRFAQDDNFY